MHMRGEPTAGTIQPSHKALHAKRRTDCTERRPTHLLHVLYLAPLPKNRHPGEVPFWIQARGLEENEGPEKKGF